MKLTRTEHVETDGVIIIWCFFDVMSYLVFLWCGVISGVSSVSWLPVELLTFIEYNYHNFDLRFQFKHLGLKLCIVCYNEFSTEKLKEIN
jgi:uncharacterized membrane protein